MNTDESKQSPHTPGDGLAESDMLLSLGEDSEVKKMDKVQNLEVDVIKHGDLTSQNEEEKEGQPQQIIEDGATPTPTDNKNNPDFIKSCIANTTTAAAGGGASSNMAATEQPEESTSKAVTFAEDIEVYDLKAGTPITVSLDTPVHLIEPPEENGAWTVGGSKIEVDLKDGPLATPSSTAAAATTTPTTYADEQINNKDNEGFVSADLMTSSSAAAARPSSIVEAETGQEILSGLVEKQATRPSMLDLNHHTKTADKNVTSPAVCLEDIAVITPTTATTISHTPPLESKLLEKEHQQHHTPAGSVDPAVDQKFIVSAVDESELHLDSAPAHSHATSGGEESVVINNFRVPSSLSLKRDGVGRQGLMDDIPHVLKESTVSGHSSHSNDSMQHDTIGPLENPAFLKTLQYSASQRFDEEEPFALHSNIDLCSLAVGQNDPNLDGGWAWVVLAAAFVNLIILSASCLLAGVMMTSYLDVTKADMTQTSWIGSIYIAIMCLAGPFVGTVTRKFGARPTICAAGFVMFLGFLGASFSDTVLHLVLTHSLVAGIGAGLAINPTFVIVGQYFNRLRGLACGLMAAGGGAGFLAGGALISQLLSAYYLSGAYLIWAAVCFNVTAMGMLMRPSPEEKLRQVEKTLMIDDTTIFNTTSQHELASGHNSMMSGLNSMYSGTDQHSMFSGMTSEGRRSYHLQRHPSKHSSGGDADVPLLKSIFHREMSRSSHSMSTNRSSYSHRHHRSQNQIASASMQRVHSPYESSHLAAPSSPAASPSATSPLTVNHHHGRSTLSTHNITSTNSLATPNNSHFLQSTSTLAAPSSVGGGGGGGGSNSAAPASPTSTRATTRSSFHRPRLMSSISQPTSHYTSLSYISQRLSFRDSVGNPRDLDNESITSTLITNLRPCDTLTPRYALGSMSISAVIGSLASFPTSLAIINDDLSRVDKITPSKKRDKTVRDYVIDMLDALRVIFNNRPFVVFLGTCFLWAFGESPVMLYLSSYAISVGTDPMQASALYTAMGVGSIAGRFLTGLIATDSNIGPMLLHTGCLGLSGLLVIVSPLITATVTQQMLFSALLGVYLGSLVPLMSLMTIELLGISELSVGFGFLYMAQGFGYLIGPPLAGALVGQIGFHYSFVFAGCLLISGSLLGLFIPMLIDVEEEDDNNSMDDLERVLHKVANNDDDDDDDDNDDNDSNSDIDDREDDDDMNSKKGKEEDLKNKSEVPPTVGSAGENHQTVLIPEDSAFVNMVRNLDEGDDKLETIKEVV